MTTTRTHATITIKHAETIDCGQYTVKLSNEVSEISADFTVRITGEEDFVSIRMNGVENRIKINSQIRGISPDVLQSFHPIVCEVSSCFVLGVHLICLGSS